MFALLPASIAMFQGIGDDPGCQNMTVFKMIQTNQTFHSFENVTTQTKLDSKPLFSIFTYFNIIFGLMCLSAISFILINFLPVSKKSQRKDQKISVENQQQENSLLEKQPTKIEENKTTNNLTELIVLQSIIFANMFVFYGVLPGLMSYSALPYGNTTFHLSINLCKKFIAFNTF